MTPDIIPIIAIGFLLFLVVLGNTIVRGKKKNSIKNQPKSKSNFKKGLLDSDNAEDYRSKHSKRETARKLFAAVSIAHDTDACSEIKAISNVRYLAREAPLIPLKNCAKSHQCNCRYIHHVDRRSAQRRIGFATIASDAMNDNRREAIGKKGRRSTDR